MSRKKKMDIRKHLENEHTRVGAEIERLRDAGRHLTSLIQNRTVEKSLEYLLTQIEKAILSLETDSYGMCEACGDPIDPARMQVLPYATMCVRCKNFQESIKRRNKVVNMVGQVLGGSP